MSTGPAPLTPETVDELLSAELDGDFDAAASDLGLTPSEAREQLAAVPGVEARRVVLARARDLVASSPSLDPAATDGLVARAMAGALVTDVRDHRERAERRWRVLVVTGSVAAAIAVVVGIGALHGHSSADSSKASAAAPLVTGGDAAKRPATSRGTGAGSTAEKNALSGPIDFGDVTAGGALRGLALDQLSRLAGADASVPQPESANHPTSGSTTFAPGALSGNGQVGSPADTSDRTFGPNARDCTAGVRRRFGIPSAPVLLGTGSVSSRPVEILVFEVAGSPVAYVVSAADCSLVRIQRL